MAPRKSDLFLTYLWIILFLFCFTLVHAHVQQHRDAPLMAEKRRIVAEYELSDLALFTDARYTRHPGVADFNAPFQDYPFSFEHFPSGSIIPLPPHLIPKRAQHAGH
jgi:hypothetical protein